MGRPSFAPTDEQRKQVSDWTQARVSVEEIARRLDLAPKTLRKHFAAELKLVQAETVITREVTRFVPTQDQQRCVLILAGARLSHDEIARKLNLPLAVLEEHFARELEEGPAKCKADVLEAMFFAGRGGNVAAAKVYLLFNGQEDPGTREMQPAANGLKGKKEQAAIAAQTAESGTPWESLVTPTDRPN